MRIAAVLNPEDPTDSPAFRILPTAAPALGLDVRILEVHEASELDAAFVRAARDGAQALFVGQSPLFTSHRSDIASIKLPTMLGWREFVEAGGLMSYGPNLPEVYRHSATLVDKILKGVSPADLPVETPTDFELVVNLKPLKR